MSSNFPTSLQDLDPSRGTTGQPLSAPNHITHHALEDATIEALEAKLGINNSTDATSIDYLLKSVLSINPGHKHTAASLTLALSNLTDVSITSPADGNGLVYDGATGKWKNATTSVADASVTVKGVTKLSVVPASPTVPIAVGDNDPRFTTSSGTAVSGSNKAIDQLGLQEGSELFAVDSAGTDAYAITLSPAPAAYVQSMTVRFKAGTANTGAATLNVNTLGAKTIKRPDGSDLLTGDIASGQIVEVAYDGVNFQLLSTLLYVPKSFITTFTRAFEASGTVNIAHGLGKLPSYVRVTGSVNSSNGEGGFGVYNGTTTSGGWQQDANDGSGNSYHVGSFIEVGTNGNNPSPSKQSASVTFDATNVTLNWTKTNGGTATYSFVLEVFA